MEMSRCFVGERIYGDMRDKKIDKPNFQINGDTRAHEILNLPDAEGNGDYHESLIKNTEKSKLLQFFLISSICHEATAETNSSTGEIAYSNSLLDMPLIKGANQMGFVLNKRTSNTIEIKNEYTQKTEIWEILFLIPFNSYRKKTTIFVKKAECQKNIVYLFSKGAPSGMMPISKFTDDSAYTKAKDVIEKFTSEGLRIGVLAMKVIENSEFSDWFSKIQEAEKIENGDLKDNKLNELYNEMENNFNFTGIYALENIIQEGVSETIHSFMKSGKKFWILSSCLREEILNCAKKCGFLDNNEINKIIDLTGISIEEIENRLDSVLNNLKIKCNDFNKLKTLHTDEVYYLLVDGNASNLIFQKQEVTLKFLKVAVLCRSVFGFRLPPQNKMQFAAKIKELTNLITMSIGCGANDVPLMTCSHVRICLEECEDNMVKEVAEFKIPKFQNLKDF
jgi:magnesium-transporting ATPase (P-type)